MLIGMLLLLIELLILLIFADRNVVTADRIVDTADFLHLCVITMKIVVKKNTVKIKTETNLLI